MVPHLSKSRLMAWRQCPRRLWLHVHRKDLEHYSDEAERRFRIGFQIGEVARGLHMGGILIETSDPAQALAGTRRALIDHPDRPIFEAAFQRDGVFVRADVLLPEPGGYRLREVKASTRVKDEHLEDCAIQGWVVGTLVSLSGVEIAHVDNSFVYPGSGDYRGLLKSVTMDADAAVLQPEVPKWVADAHVILAGPEPSIAPGVQCNKPYACPFQDHCTADLPPGPAYPIGLLPRLSGTRLDSLEALGIEDVRDIPENFSLTLNQARVVQVIRTGVPMLDSAAAGILHDLPYPRFYLDFETISVAVPLWRGTRPYRQLPVQWSCHVEFGPGDLHHRAFLADGFDDPRRGFAEQLINTVGDHGPVFVYNQGFEAGCLRELAASFPDLAAQLDAIIGRMFDLLPMTRDHYCHPEMRGSWSLKAVLPTIAPDLGYDGLEVGDGGDAQAGWLEIYHPDTADERRAALREALAAYCMLDTLACVRLVWFLSGQGVADSKD